MSIKTIKVIGIAVAVLGAGLSLVGNWASEKQQDAKIAEKVAEAVAKATKVES